MYWGMTRPAVSEEQVNTLLASVEQKQSNEAAENEQHHSQTNKGLKSVG